MFYHSNHIEPFDIFLVDTKYDKHYYVCIYAQDLDGNNKLNSDIYGLVITTNPKYEKLSYNDYNVSIEINDKKAYVNCDKLVRIKLKDNVQKKQFFIPHQTRKEIRYNLDKFITEIKKQTAEEATL